MKTFCRLFVHTSRSQKELLEQIAFAIKGDIEHSSVFTLFLELDVIKNENADAELSRVFPDGFVHFNFSLEFETNESSDIANYQQEIGTLLLFFWNNNCPAVAACDFETDLPFSGGYKNESLPWPGK